MNALFPPLRPNLGAALRDVGSENARARAAAAEALGAAPEERADEAKEALRPLVDDPSPAVRCAALASLGRLGDAEALDDIVARFEDLDPTVRQVALIAAGDVGDPKVAPALERALRRDEPEVRFQALASLATLLGEAAVGPLSTRLDDDDAEVRAHLAEALGSLEVEAAVEPLRALLEDAEPLVRQSAAVGLARCGDAAGAGERVGLLTARARAVEAAWALGELEVEAATEPRARLASSWLKPLAVRAAAAAALVRLGDPRGEPVLRRVVRAFRPDARGYAAQLIGELRLASLAPEVVRLVDRPRGADPVVVVEALSKLAEVSEAAAAALARAAARDGPAGARARAQQR